MSDTNIVPVSAGGSMSIIPQDDERKFFSSISDVPFLPSLKLIQGTNPEIEKGAQQGTFFVTLLDRKLTNKVIITVCARRAHALLLENNKKVKESFNYASPIFKEIIATQSTKDQSVRSSYSIGDFLLYLPEEDIFCTFFPGQKTLRPVAFDIIDYGTPPEGRAIDSRKNWPHTNVFTLNSEWKKYGTSFRSFIPVVTPLACDPSFWPTPEALAQPKAIFYKPVIDEMGVEEAPVDTNVGR